MVHIFKLCFTNALGMRLCCNLVGYWSLIGGIIAFHAMDVLPAMDLTHAHTYIHVMQSHRFTGPNLYHTFRAKFLKKKLKSKNLSLKKMLSLENK